jgi:hypothetical protein
MLTVFACNLKLFTLIFCRGRLDLIFVSALFHALLLICPQKLFCLQFFYQPPLFLVFIIQFFKELILWLFIHSSVFPLPLFFIIALRQF